MKLVVIAGGKGTRLGLRDIPKPMVELDGMPILERQIRLAKRYGLTDITILSSHLAEVTMDYFGDGSAWGVDIEHFVEPSPLGTAGAVKQLESSLEDRFMVFYGDTVMDIDLARLIEFDAALPESMATLVVHPNDHPHDSDLLELDATGRVTAFYAKPHAPNSYRRNLVNAALYILSPEIFEHIPPDTALDFGRQVFPELAPSGKLFGYRTTEYIKDMGTPKRLEKIEKDVTSGKVANRNLSNTQRAIFLDRDGVINEDVDNLTRLEDFRLLDGVAEAVTRINQSEYLCIVVTNQPVIAKGFISEPELDAIHAKMDSLLGAAGAFVDDLFYCPHHPEKGWEGEVPELKVECDCRKPANGLLLEAAKRYHIDLSASWMVGDRVSDVEAGMASGCRTVLLAPKSGPTVSGGPTLTCGDLREAMAAILPDEARSEHDHH